MSKYGVFECEKFLKDESLFKIDPSISVTVQFVFGEMILFWDMNGFDSLICGVECSCEIVSVVKILIQLFLESNIDCEVANSV